MLKTLGKFFAMCLVTVIVASGCSNNMDKAINMLGGTEEEQNEALQIIQVEAMDPLPDLKKAIKNKDLSATARKNVALLIGSTSDKMGDSSAVPVLMEVISGSEPEVQEAIVEALEKIPGKEALEALQELLGNEDDVIAELAWNILDAKSRELEGEADALVGDGATDTKIGLLEEAVAINPMNHRLVMKLADLYKYKGEEEKALQLYNQGGEYVKSFMVVGPFPGKSDEDFITPATVDYSAKMTGDDDEEVEWFEFTEVGGDGVADFRKEKKTKSSKATFYVSLNIESAEQVDSVVKLFTEDAVKVWIGDEKVFEAEQVESEEGEEGEVEKINEYKIKTQLKKGKTPVLIRLQSRRYAKFSLRVSDLKQKRIEGISYSN